MQSSDESRSHLNRSLPQQEAGIGAQCPFCSSGNVKKISQFGKAQLVNQYYCEDCRSVFERIRWRQTDSSAGDMK